MEEDNYSLLLVLHDYQTDYLNLNPSETSSTASTAISYIRDRRYDLDIMRLLRNNW